MYHIFFFPRCSKEFLAFSLRSANSINLSLGISFSIFSFSMLFQIFFFLYFSWAGFLFLMNIFVCLFSSLGTTFLENLGLLWLIPILHVLAWAFRKICSYAADATVLLPVSSRVFLTVLIHFVFPNPVWFVCLIWLHLSVHAKFKCHLTGFALG